MPGPSTPAVVIWPRLRMAALGMGAILSFVVFPAAADRGQGVARSTRGLVRLPSIREDISTPTGRDWLNRLGPLTDAQVRRIRWIVSRSDRRDLHAFAKIGDSMTVSRSYLTCFARDEADFGAFDGISSVIEHFSAERASRAGSFARESLAARVGWSARSAVAGSSSPVAREIRTTRPRFATVMFGTNDLEARSPRRFVRSMWTLLEMLERRGVVPLVSTIPPRADPDDDRWVPRYNLLIRALTEGRDLPLYDLHEDLERLPRRGLAGDGLHANVLLEDGRGRACDFTRRGLDFGHNVRNLRTLQHLERLVKVASGEDVPTIWNDSRGDRADEPGSTVRLPLTRVVRWEPGVSPSWSFALRQSATVRAVTVSKDGEAPVARLQSMVGDVLSENRWGTTAVLEPGRYVFSVAEEPDLTTELLVTLTAEPAPRLED